MMKVNNIFTRICANYVNGIETTTTLFSAVQRQLKT